MADISKSNETITGRLVSGKPFGLSAWLIFILTLALTLLATLFTIKSVNDDYKKEFLFRCSEIQSEIRNRLSAYAQILWNGSALFEASDSVSRSEWQHYITHINRNFALPGIQGIGFSQIIYPSQLKAHEQHVRNEGFPAYCVVPAGERDIYTSIVFIQPFRDRNLRAFGYDMFAEPVRRAAMEKARDMNIASLSGKVHLVQETNVDVQAGTLMYVPVYKSGMPLITIDDRRKAIKGWVYSPYRMKDMFTHLLSKNVSHNKLNLVLDIYDGETALESQLLYSSPTKALVLKNANRKFEHTTIIDFNGTKWLLAFSEPVTLSLFFKSTQVQLVFWGGLAISMLISLLALSLIKIRHNLSVTTGLARSLSENLEKHIALYNAIPDAILVSDAATGQIDDFNNKAVVQYGYDRNEFQQINYSNILAGSVHSSHQKNNANSLSTNTYHIHSNGNIFPVEISRSHFEIDGSTKQVIVARDITNKLLAETDLLIKNEAFENSFAGQVILDTLGNIVFANKAFLKMWGFNTNNQVIGKPNQILFADLNDAIVISKSLEATDGWKGIITAKRFDNTTFISRAYTSVIRNRNGEMIGYQSTTIDVTREKEDEARLVEYKQAIAQSVEGILMIDSDRKIKFVNHSWINMHGFNELNVANQLLDIFHSPAQMVDEVLPLLQTVSNEGNHSCEINHQDAKGKIFPTWTSCTILKDTDNQINGYLFAVQDITLRKQAEAELERSKNHYRLLVENSNDAICVTTADKLLFANIRFEQMIGLSSAQMIDQSYTHLIYDEDRDELIRHYYQISEGVPMIKQEARIVTKMNQIRWAEFSGVAIDWDGQKAILSFISDITERHQAEAITQATLKEKEVLLREIHHRVKNNLQVVSSLLNLQAAKIDNPAFKALLEQSRNRIRSIALVHEKLYQSGNFAKINLKEYTNSLVNELFRVYVADPRAITINNQVEDVEIPLIYAIPCGLILNEIITNSIKYAFPAGFQNPNGATISINLKTLPDNSIRLVCSDNGIGLPAGFDLNNTNSLGLYLINILATEQLDGNIEINTEKGTIFTITFNPVHK